LRNRRVFLVDAGEPCNRLQIVNFHHLVTQSGNRRYAQLVESFRNEDGKPRQRTVCTLGRLDAGGEVDTLIASLVANPFAGIKVRGGARSSPMDEGRVFSEGEWAIIRAVANGLEWSYGWKLPAAQRLRFVLDFAYATGLRSSEFVGATLGQIETDVHGDHWLKLVGKGSKAGKVALPPLAKVALDHYLMQRGVPTTPAMWKPSTPLIADLQNGGGSSRITSSRLWDVTNRFFKTTADAIEAESPKTAEKLRRASPHWMRHTHATHALARGAELTTVRDNLRHASVSTTSVYLHTDQVKRARQMRDAFGTPNG
jgi:integrase